MVGGNTKTLVFLSILLIVLGFAVVWFGSNQGVYTQPVVSPLPSAATQSTPIATSSAVFGIEGERVSVTKVVDGDTIEISTGQIVRFIGIDTPETVDPRRPVGCFGKEASNEAKRLLLNKEVILQKDISDTDKYRRLLRYIYLPLENGQTLFVNDYLVREGYAKVLTYPPDVKYNGQLREAEEQAREGKKGLWKKCI